MCSHARLIFITKCQHKSLDVGLLYCIVLYGKPQLSNSISTFIVTNSLLKEHTGTDSYHKFSRAWPLFIVYTDSHYICNSLRIACFIITWVLTYNVFATEKEIIAKALKYREN